jgi:hypothetical protein
MKSLWQSEKLPAVEQLTFGQQGGQPVVDPADA